MATGGGCSMQLTQRRCYSSATTNGATGPIARGVKAPSLLARPQQQQQQPLGAAAPQQQHLGRGERLQARAVDPAALSDVVAQVAPHLPLLYEPVALPCSMMKCGDVLHRSTLDLALRGENNGPDWFTISLIGGPMLFYLFMPPGVLPGAFDYYVKAKMRSSERAYSKDDITLGRKLATGGFGTVFRGEMKLLDGTQAEVIVKKAKEFGQAETWMNERMTRLGGAHVAEFVTAFDETLNLSPEEQARRNSKKKRNGAGNGSGNGNALNDDAVWLVWKYEGDNTLFNLMESKEFPYNLEPLLLDRELRLPKGVERKAVTVRLAFKQLLEALAAMHATGIVHRDVKPQNCIISERDNKIKLIDLGAAADLRIGINYAPQEYLMDPRYAPPQQYVMSTQTPKPPPLPVAALLSPILWRMENPDRFDMWSCGVTLLQMVFPPLRNDNNLIAFNKRLEALKYDLRAWRREEEARKGGMKPEMAEGFALLDLDGGAGWTLLNELMAFKPTDRCSAAEALVSPFFTGSGVTSPSEPVPVVASRSALSAAARVLNKTLDSDIISGFVSSATGQDRGSLTEAQLKQELGLEEPAPMSTRRASNTIVWWKERQSEMRKSIEKRQGEGSQGTAGIPMRGASAGRRSLSASPPASGQSNGNGRTPSPASSQQQQQQQQSSAASQPPPLASWLGALAGGSASKPSKANAIGNGQAVAVAAQRNGNGNGAGGKEKSARSASDLTGAAASLLRGSPLLSWGGSSAGDSSEEEQQRRGGSGDEEREVELVGQKRAGGLGFLSNVLGGRGRGGSGGNN